MDSLVVPVRVIYETRVAGEIATYDFDDLAFRVLPADRDELRSMRLAKQLRLLRVEQRAGRHTCVEPWVAPSGFQDLMLFLSTCAIAIAPLVSTTQQLRAEVSGLGGNSPGL
jgi:hypothetical protein